MLRLGASLLAALLALSCATGSRAGGDRVTEELSTLVGAGPAPAAAPVSASTAVSSAQGAAPELPLLSDARRADPLSQPLLVLGLPLPELRLPATSAELTAPLRPAPAPAPALASLAPLPLGEPPLPPRLGSAKPVKAPQSGAGREASLQAPVPAGTKAGAGSSPTPPTAVAGTGTAGAAKTGSSGGKEPPARPAPAAPQPSPALTPAPEPAAAETIPSIPPSLRPLVDLSSPQADPAPRSFSVELGSRVSIPFVGTGWTYLGERDGKEGVLYDSRRFEGQGALFTLLGSRQGSYRLRFLHQDLERGTTNEEVVGLEVLPKGSLLSQAPGGAAASPAAAGLLPAPGAGVPTGSLASAPSAGGAPSPAAPQTPVANSAAGNPAPGGQGARVGTASLPAASAATAPPGSTALGGGTAVAASPAVPAAGQPAGGGGQLAAPAAPQPAAGGSPAPAPGSPEAYLATARAEYAAGRAPTTIAAAEAFLALSPAGPGADEALWLEAQALELNSPARDIAKALGLYRRLTEAWPRSPFWTKADARASYIQRYYFDIR